MSSAISYPFTPGFVPGAYQYEVRVVCPTLGYDILSDFALPWVWFPLPG